MISTYNFSEYLPRLLELAKQPRQRRGGQSGAYFRSYAHVSELGFLLGDFKLKTGVPENARLQLDFLCIQPRGGLRPHRDNMVGGILQYLIMLQPATAGGILTFHFGKTTTAVPTQAGECVSFDANTIEHSVSKVEEGERHVLSIWHLGPNAPVRRF